MESQHAAADHRYKKLNKRKYGHIFLVQDLWFVGTVYHGAKNTTVSGLYRFEGESNKPKSIILIIRWPRIEKHVKYTDPNLNGNKPANSNHDSSFDTLLEGLENWYRKYKV